MTRHLAIQVFIQNVVKYSRFDKSCHLVSTRSSCAGAFGVLLIKGGTGSSLQPPLTFEAHRKALRPVVPEALLPSVRSSPRQSASSSPFGTDPPRHRSSCIPSNPFNPFDPSIPLEPLTAHLVQNTALVKSSSIISIPMYI
ncbi:hypothetical protein CROQUDRAFT_657761 [Cronartium quercuum f. sp. fusiforme G11]|uniref:Uncharacterized protein n=1 Tax=Cronartium quercuum f. sp. fusiforme G11 TaxID=708437 RepID=A0A9P6NLC0_9BASI|nr:hypothetical protein CROQUDRAFT_657761 [Cronartium quercuum f. sp. fusiforme G11]